jgi:hypothetical protein
LQAANDNRTPAEHRAIIAGNPKPTNRQWKGNRWPTSARLIAQGCPHMAMALNDWAALQSGPVTCVANDDWVDPDDAEAGEMLETRWDNLMTTQSARQTIKLEAAGEDWKPHEERFDTPRRNDRAKAAPPTGSYRNNG